jgi:hypothetical protein
MTRDELRRLRIDRLPLDDKDALADRLREQLPEQRLFERSRGPIDPEGNTLPIQITFEGLPKLK